MYYIIRISNDGELMQVYHAQPQKTLAEAQTLANKFAKTTQNGTFSVIGEWQFKQLNRLVSHKPFSTNGS